MNLLLKRTPGIYLLGFMGSGKSTVGRLLAERLGWPFIDLDDEIERVEQTTIAAIFDSYGEAVFRGIESAVLVHCVRRVERGQPAVIALGGGAFMEAANRELLSGRGLTIWLDCAFEVIERRVRETPHRPLARDPSKLAELYAVRRPTYQVADLHIAITGDDPATAVDAILAHPLLQ